MLSLLVSSAAAVPTTTSAQAYVSSVKTFIGQQIAADINLYKSIEPVGQTLVYGGITMPGATQNYVCQNGTFVLASANATINFGLVNHYFQSFGGKPTWKHVDGSIVTGGGKKGFDSPADPVKNIKWLSVSPVTTENVGTFGSVKTVLRTFTVGGVAPATCTGSEQKRVPYGALYTYYA
ncbi:hypothetical protein EDD86DRAFT_133656 [Gorgonomyces haynaldii]|nr:hypothetical protein EDD86DRAFT_133656 [Gorgonomyces haynaldii]